MQTLKYTIPFIPPSNNKFKGRQNAWEYRALKKEWSQIVGIYCKSIPSTPIAKSNLTITYYFKTKSRHDPDNYNGVFILDGLVAKGIIQDDNFNCINLILKGAWDKSNPRTEIVIEEVE